VLEVLRRMSRLGITIIIVIHQPSRLLYSFFDSAIYMNQGLVRQIKKKQAT
jgi:hypothetical protein